MDDHDRLVRALFVERYRLSPRRQDTSVASLAELDAAIAEAPSRENGVDGATAVAARRRRRA
jgi:hypothetical protein